MHNLHTCTAQTNKPTSFEQILASLCKGKKFFGLKVGWQINCTISLNIYLCWLEILFGYEIYEKNPPPSSLC